MDINGRFLKLIILNVMFDIAMLRMRNLVTYISVWIFRWKDLRFPSALIDYAYF